MSTAHHISVKLTTIRTIHKLVCRLWETHLARNTARKLCAVLIAVSYDVKIITSLSTCVNNTESTESII